MFRSAVKRVIRSAGYELKRYVQPQTESPPLIRMLSWWHVNLVLDVGANAGQFASSLRKAGYTGRIVSFEPLAEPWQKLNEASRGDELWEVAPRGAIGAEDGELEIHVAGNSWSSSALGMLDAHLRIAPDSKYVSSERVPLQRLDSAASSYLRSDSVLLIKADVQGFEGEVLKGAKELLKAAVGLHLELSFVPLYEGQYAYDQLIVDMKNAGFTIWSLEPEYIEQESGRMAWGAGVFFRG